jgi:hypothetical protein
LNRNAFGAHRSGSPTRGSALQCFDSMAARRWEDDERGEGVADASQFADGASEPIAAMRRPNWVAEQPELHLPPATPPTRLRGAPASHPRRTTPPMTACTTSSSVGRDTKSELALFAQLSSAYLVPSPSPPATSDSRQSAPMTIRTRRRPSRSSPAWSTKCPSNRMATLCGLAWRSRRSSIPDLGTRLPSPESAAQPDRRTVARAEVTTQSMSDGLPGTN